MQTTGAADVHHSLLAELQKSDYVGTRGMTMGAVMTNDPATDVADAPTKCFLRDGRGRVRAVLMISSSVNPLLVARSASMAKAAKQALGPDLGRVILTPLADGTFEGLSYVLWPAQRRLASPGLTRFVQKRILKRRVPPWLRKSTRHTRKQATRDDLERAYVRPLETMSEDSRFSEDIRRRARTGLSRIDAGAWRPFLILEHNDLWLGNILLADDRVAKKRNPHGFFVVDWAGATIEGHPFYDLIRFGRSVGMSTHSLAQEARAHCDILECELEDMVSYLLAGLAAIGMNLEHFPEDRYLAMSNTVLGQLDAMVGLLERRRA